MNHGPISEDSPAAPRHPDLRPRKNALQPFAVRKDGPETAPPERQPPHPPGAPELLERAAVRLERRSAWTMLLAPPLVLTTFTINPFGLVGVLLGLLANVVAIGAAYGNRTGRARDAAGFAALSYAAGGFVHLLSAPWVAVSFVPLALAVRWLRLASEHRREAWRIAYAARRGVDEQARRRRDRALLGQPAAGHDDEARCP